MKLKRIGIFSLIAVMLLGTLTGCNKGPTIINPNGEIESSEEDHAPIDKTQYMPVYDYKSLPLSNKLKNEELESYYMRQLSERAIICYDEIYNAAMTFQKEIVLSKSISPEALKQIMNIIYIDTPELYMLETEYAYDTDSNGNVYKVYLTYTMTKETYEFIDPTIIKKVVGEISAFKKEGNEFDAELEIIAEVESINYATTVPENDYFSGKNAASSFFSAVKQNKGDSLAAAKLFSYYCRRSGIDSMVVIGELTNTDYANKIGLNLKPYKEPAEAIKEVVEGTHVKVIADYSTFYAWNMVKLNENWYHVDVLFPVLWQKTDDDIDSMQIEKIRTTLNIDDYTASQSRIFYMNEDLLGLAPECNSKDFQALYRSGNCFLNYNSNQMVIAMTSRLDDLVRNKEKKIIYQFCSEETYNIFINTFKSTLENYNKNNANVIQNYRLIENKETLSLVLCDLIYLK